MVGEVALLFDSTKVVQAEAAQRDERSRIRRRAQEVDEALQELGELDASSEALKKQLASAQAVQAVVYAEYRRPGKRWMIEHARAGADYIYQLFPLKPPTVAWQDVVVMAIAAMDVIFPTSINITYTPPSEEYQVKFYTIKAQKVVGLPGWEDACIARALVALTEIDAWQ
jgi:hypothetical protein